MFGPFLLSYDIIRYLLHHFPPLPPFVLDFISVVVLFSGRMYS